MKTDAILETERLTLRPWTTSNEDRAFFHHVNSNEEMMQFFPSRYTRQVADERLEMMIQKGREQGLCWAVASLRDTGELIGFTGLFHVTFEADFAPTVEIGWRYTPHHWKKGYATEAANELLRHGFDDLDLPEIVAFAVVNNAPSIAVMKSIGMHEYADSPFDHPSIPDAQEHLKSHVLYGIRADEWRSQKEPET